MFNRFGIGMADQAAAGAGGSAISAIAPAVPTPAASGLPALRLRRRSVRVLCSTTAIVLMSLADLWITLVYVGSVGMGEGNPIARYVMQHWSQNGLIAWKCASISLAALVFVRYRQRRVTEIASWFCCGVLVWLLLRWIGYAEEVWSLTSMLHVLPEAEAAVWVKMGE